jgi:hypothetical protein
MFVFHQISRMTIWSPKKRKKKPPLNMVCNWLLTKDIKSFGIAFPVFVVCVEKTEFKLFKKEFKSFEGPEPIRKLKLKFGGLLLSIKFKCR